MFLVSVNFQVFCLLSTVVVVSTLSHQMEEHSCQHVNSSAVVFRICFEAGHQVDWHVMDPHAIVFQDVLDAISEVSCVCLMHKHVLIDICH